MSTRHTPGLFDRFLDAISAFFGAVAVPQAIRVERDPDPREMRRLGLDPRATHRDTRF